MKEAQVIIAGAGIAGLAAALAVAPSPVVILERAAAFAELGAGLQLGPNAVRALQNLGAWEAVAPSAFAPPEIHIRDGLRGTILKRLRLKRFEEIYGAPYRVIHRQDLHRALLATVSADRGMDIRLGQAVTGWGPAAQGIAVATPQSTIGGSLVVACDGVHSTLRQLLIPGAAPVDSGYVMHRTLLGHIPAIPNIAWECINLWLSPGAHVVHYPVGKNRRLNIVATVKSGVRLADAHDNCCTAIRDLLSSAVNWQPWPGLYVTPIPRWLHDGVLLLGDAAHGSLPFLAQGAAMALEDAAYLKLNQASITEASTWNVRQSRTARLHTATMTAAYHYHAGGLHAFCRNLAIRLMPQSFLLARQGWIYRY